MRSKKAKLGQKSSYKKEPVAPATVTARSRRHAIIALFCPVTSPNISIQLNAKRKGFFSPVLNNNSQNGLDQERGDTRRS